MKQCILLVAILVVSISCSTESNKTYNSSARTVVTGKVINRQTDQQTISLFVNRVGFAQEEFETKLDSTGSFEIEFATYVPVDAWLKYQVNTLVILRPADSLYVELDGVHQKRNELLETIKYGGSAAEINKQIGIYQKQYYSSSIYIYDNDKLTIATKNYEPERFREFADSIRQEEKKFLNNFIEQYKPDEFVQSWITYNIYEDYYGILTFYPDDHRKANVLKQSEWTVPISYYDYFSEPLSIEVEKGLPSGYAVNDYLDKYLSYMWRLTRDELKDLNRKSSVESTFAFDSIALDKIMKHTPQGLFRETMLTYVFNNFIEKSEIESFDKFKSLAESNIHIAFLRETLFKKYETAKEKIINAEEIAVNRIRSLDTFMNGLFTKSKGKVVYVDIWATWCGPCRAEFPYSKKLHDEFSDKVEFVYMCIDSEEFAYKNTLKKIQIPGVHYFFDSEQSLAIHEKLKFEGVPFYILIDQNGNPVNRGYRFKPSEDETIKRIKDLVKE